MFKFDHLGALLVTRREALVKTITTHVGQGLTLEERMRPGRLSLQFNGSDREEQDLNASTGTFGINHHQDANPEIILIPSAKSQHVSRARPQFSIKEIRTPIRARNPILVRPRTACRQRRRDRPGRNHRARDEARADAPLGRHEHLRRLFLVIELRQDPGDVPHRARKERAAADADGVSATLWEGGLYGAGRVHGEVDARLRRVVCRGME